MWLSVLVSLALSILFVNQNRLLTFIEYRDNIVDLGYARYRGNRTFSSTVAYLGIPYAEPPLGELRFRAPVPLNLTRVSELSNGKIFEASEYPEPCIQGSQTGEDAGGAGSEDCLKVNIYTPVNATKKSRLPVLFYIHGGGYIFGNPASWPYDHWIRQSPNVVIVSTYYRLSSFGFLGLPEFNDNPTYGDLNVGFRDQIAALKWVKRNIAAFGGNPDQVTINGESAGGSSVELHLIADQKERLFAGAIAQSVYRTPVPQPEQQRTLFQFYTEKAGCGEGSLRIQMACLRSASVSILARAQDAANSPTFKNGYKIFRPVVDGNLITDYPTKLISEGRFNRVPLIVGATTNETSSEGSDLHKSMQKFFPSVDKRDLDDILTVYSREEFNPETLYFQTVTGESQFRCSVSLMAKAFFPAVDTWTYRYNQRNPTNDVPGVAHAAENWLMFQGSKTGVNGSTTFTGLMPVEQAFAEELIAYWLSFVRSGDPNTYRLPGAPEWPGYGKGRARIVLQQHEMNSADASGGVIEHVSLAETRRCAMIGRKVHHQQN